MSTPSIAAKDKGSDPSTWAQQSGILIFQMPVPELHAPFERDLLRDRAYATLRDAIVDGTLAPGERLRDQELCEWLGLSRTPVRDALSRLEQDGLVETAPQRYTRVAPLDRRAARDAFPIVAAVHALAAELGVPRLTATDLDAMREANAQLRGRAAKTSTSTPRSPPTTPSTPCSLTASANAELTGVLDRLMPRLRRLERLRFGSLAGRASTRQHERDPRRRDRQRHHHDRRARPGELALARDPDRPELRMTAIAPPDIHDARTLAAARALLDAAADPQQMQREVLAAVARNEQWRGQRVHQPARARGADEPDGPAAAVAPRSASARPRATSARSTAGSPAHATSTRSRRCASSSSSGCSRPTTPSTGWSRA